MSKSNAEPVQETLPIPAAEPEPRRRITDPTVKVLAQMMNMLSDLDPPARRRCLVFLNDVFAEPPVPLDQPR